MVVALILAIVGGFAVGFGFLAALLDFHGEGVVPAGFISTEAIWVMGYGAAFIGASLVITAVV